MNDVTRDDACEQFCLDRAIVLIIPKHYIASIERTFDGNRFESRALVVRSSVLEDSVFLFRSNSSPSEHVPTGHPHLCRGAVASFTNRPSFPKYKLVRFASVMPMHPLKNSVMFWPY